MVNFKALHTTVDREVDNEKVISHPPISQRSFLENLGIDARMISLLRNTEKIGTRNGEREVEKLIQAFNRLVNVMGTDYQVYCLYSRNVSIEEYLCE